MRELLDRHSGNGTEKIEVVLQFSDKTQDMTKIRKEIKEILFYELKNQMEHVGDSVWKRWEYC